MKMSRNETVSATELVRNLSAIIDKVRVSNRSLYITKGSQTVAELKPPPKVGLSVADFVHLLKALPSLGNDGGKFSEDLASLQHQAKLPDNPWD